MFLFGINPITHSNIKVELEDLKKENERLKYANTQYQSRLMDEMSKASFSVDWKTMNAFSVERGWDNGTHKTTIGYLLQEPCVHTETDGNQNVVYKDIVREWVLYCSADEHERLVKEFNEYKSNKK
jgi:hypothetical protein